MEQITVATPTAAQVKAKMVALDASFDVANYGCRSFRDFLGQLGQRVRTVGRSGHDITLTLIEPAAKARSATARGKCAIAPQPIRDSSVSRIDAQDHVTGITSGRLRM
jgi:hypothetical protein